MEETWKSVWTTQRAKPGNPSLSSAVCDVSIKENPVLSKRHMTLYFAADGAISITGARTLQDAKLQSQIDEDLGFALPHRQRPLFSLDTSTNGTTVDGRRLIKGQEVICHGSAASS